MIDLRELLDERSTNPPGTETMRLAQIEKRIVRRRNNRIAAIAAVVLVLFGGYLLRPSPHTPPPPEPAATPSTVLGFPMWANGARLAAAESAPLARGEVNVTWTPKTLDIMWSVRCDGLTDGQLGTFTVSASAHGQDFADTTCGGGSFITHEVRAWQDAGFKVGQPGTFTVRVSDPPGAGTASLAVYEKVAFHEFPLPPRPDTVKSVDCSHLAGKPAAESDPHDPLRPMTLAVDWSEFVEFHVRSQTPGRLHIAVNGERVRTVSFWDYEAPDLGGMWQRGSVFRPPLREPRPGERVTITLTPEHFTGAWVFHAFPGTGPRWSTACS